MRSLAYRTLAPAARLFHRVAHAERVTIVMYHAIVASPLPLPDWCFLDETLWPEFVAVDRVLHQHLGELTHRVIADVVHDDPTEVAVVAEPPQLPLPSLG